MIDVGHLHVRKVVRRHASCMVWSAVSGMHISRLLIPGSVVKDLPSRHLTGRPARRNSSKYL